MTFTEPIGYLHVCQPGRQALVYDLMEPYRPQVDREVLAFVRSQTFTPRDFVIDAKGVCRLHPDLARLIAALDVGSAEHTLHTTQTVQLLRAHGPEGAPRPLPYGFAPPTSSDVVPAE